MGKTARWMGATMGALAFTLMLGVGCSSSDSGSSGSGGGSSANTCWPSDPVCKMPTGVGFECLALYDNGVGDKGTYRMSQLQVLKPDVLAGKFLQETVVSKAITLKWPSCLQEGYGRFNWLFEVDWAAGKVRTGGGHIPADPKDGYCFIDETIAGFHAQPIEVDITVGVDAKGRRTFDTVQSIPTLNVPIWLDDMEVTSLMMPLHDVSLTEGVVEKDNDCIGTWDGDGLSYDNNCKPDPTIGQRMQWKNGSVLKGYITAEESDQVWIPDLQQTLCVALSGDAAEYGEDTTKDGHTGKFCKRDASNKILAAVKADWCQASNSACTPPEADSFRLEGQFAASGAKINDTCP